MLEIAANSEGHRPQAIAEVRTGRKKYERNALDIDELL